MRQWQIFDFPFPSAAQPHPFVILSPDFVAQSRDYVSVNAIMCVSVRGDYQMKSRDVRLDAEDGLDWATVVRCHYIFELSKIDAGRLRGAVTRARRRQIVRVIQAAFGFTEM